MDTRSGLKKVHTNFEEIQRNLDAAYTRYSGNEKVAGGIVGIWSKMSKDAILRDKIMRSGNSFRMTLLQRLSLTAPTLGLLSKSMPLLDKPATRLVGLQALSNVTHHGGADIRREIATYTPKLLQLMEEFPDDAAINEQIIVTLAHAIGSVVNDEDSSASVKAANIRKVNIPKVLDLVFKNIKKPDASHYMLSHAIEFLCNVVLGCHKEIRANPSVLNFLIALLRAKDLSTRVNALGALCRLVIPESEDDLRAMDHQKFMAAIQRGFPPHLSDILMDYSPTECDTFVILYTTRDYTKAMMRVAQDHDVYSLGKQLAEFIVRTEFSIGQGGYQYIDERTGRPELMDIGLGFKMWQDALPVCARALREKGTPADLDAADIVECKYLVMTARVPDAIRVAQRGIERSPQIAYFYYIIGLGADQPLGLRASKKGLKCKKTTPFVRHYLLWRAVDHAGQLGLSKLQSSSAGGTTYAEGVALFMSALEDAKRFVAETPPDSRHMRTVLNWLVLLSITMRGPELSPDLRELDVCDVMIFLPQSEY